MENEHKLLNEEHKAMKEECETMRRQMSAMKKLLESKLLTQAQMLTPDFIKPKTTHLIESVPHKAPEQIQVHEDITIENLNKTADDFQFKKPPPLSYTEVRDVIPPQQSPTTDFNTHWPELPKPIPRGSLEQSNSPTDYCKMSWPEPLPVIV